MIPETIVWFAIAFYISWGIGANDETMAMAAAGSSWSISRVAIIGAIFACIGAILFGQIVEKTIGTELLLIEITHRTCLTIVVSTAIWLTVASWFGWPVSTTHTALGAVIGFGIMAGGFQTINWQRFSSVIWGWLFSPFIGFLVSFVTCYVANFLGKTKDVTSSRNQTVWMRLSFLVALLTEFWRGANDVGNATAFLSMTFLDPLTARMIGGIGMAIGIIVLGRRVIFTVGTRITRLAPIATFLTQVATVLVIAVGTLMGLPLSGTHILVGSVLGAGFAEKSEINFEVVARIILAWFVTFPAGALFAMFVTYVSTFL